MAESIRERIRKIQVDMRDTDVTPMQARDYLNNLTAMIGNCNEEIKVADLAFNRILLACLDREKHANRARIVAQTTDEYQRLREAKDTKELAEAMIGSLKYMLRSLEAEMRMQ
jgi:uncharacterized protein (DUF4213/DUF364 family)